MGRRGRPPKVVSTLSTSKRNQEEEAQTGSSQLATRMETEVPESQELMEEHM